MESSPFGSSSGPSHGDVKPRPSDLAGASHDSDGEGIDFDEEELQAEDDRLDRQIKKVEVIMNKRQKLASLLAKRSTTLLTRVKTEVKTEEGLMNLEAPITPSDAVRSWKGKGKEREVIEISDSE
ncbi:hypothetical protein RQP46_001403 [Phenoliferia psychrophenolica]